MQARRTIEVILRGCPIAEECCAAAEPIERPRLGARVAELLAGVQSVLECMTPGVEAPRERESGLGDLYELQRLLPALALVGPVEQLEDGAEIVERGVG